MEKYIDPLLHILNEMSPYLLLGFLIAGLLHGFVPRRFYGRFLAADNFRSVGMAALMGIPLPLCSCGVIPTAMSLRRNGASHGATVSFLVSTPQTGVDSILATWSLLGAPFALIRPFAAFVTALFGGMMVNRFDRSPDDEVKSSDSAPELPAGFWARLKSALRYGFVDMMQDIGKWLVVGLVIAAAITVLLPDDFFDATRSYPLLNMLMVLVFAIPMYICATGSIPIAVALMMKGLSPGAALVLLMAGPATNLAAIMVISKVLRSKTTLIYLLSIIAGAIGFGLVIDCLLPASWFALPSATTAAACHSVENESLFSTLCTVVFVIMLVYAFWLGRRGGHGHHHECCGDSCDSADEVTELKVSGMRCNHCKASVIESVSSVEGVVWVEVSVENGTVVYHGHADINAVRNAIGQLGFSVA